MLTKEQFINSINFIINQDNLQNKLCDVLELLSPNTRTDCFIYSKYKTEYINMLKYAMNIREDCDSLEWWIYECDYGKINPVITTENGMEFNLETTELLYDFLIDFEVNR